MRKQQLTISARINSAAIALMIGAQYLSYIGELYLGIKSGLVVGIILVCLGMELTGCIMTWPSFRLDFQALLRYGYILFYFLFSFFLASKRNTEYLTEFLCYGTFALLACTQERDDELVLRLVMCLSLLFWISPETFMAGSLLENLTYDRMGMFYSYILIVPVTGAVIHGGFCFEKKWYLLLLYGINLATFGRAILTLGRGPMLVVFMTAAFVWNRHSLAKGRFWTAKRAAVILPVAAAAVYVFLNLYDVFIELDAFLVNHGITIALIHKMADLLSSTGSILSQRDENWRLAWQMICESPIWGNGIGEYANRYGTWPHNLFLQIAVEFGVLGLPLIWNILKRLKSACIDVVCRFDSALFYYVLCLSVVRLMLSSYLWHLPEFWLFFFFLPAAAGQSRDKEAAL